MTSKQVEKWFAAERAKLVARAERQGLELWMLNREEWHTGHTYTQWNVAIGTKRGVAIGRGKTPAAALRDGIDKAKAKEAENTVG